jgi:multiple sugar transport system substrate-binding protein
MRAWPGLKKQYFDLIPNSQKLRFLEPAALPHFNGFKSSAVFGGWNFMIPISSKKKKEALKFIKFAHQVENQKMIFEKSGFIPIMRQVYQDNAYMKKNPDLEYFESLLETGFHRPFLVDYTKISDIVSYYTHLAIKGEIGVKQALKQATRLANSKRVLIR